MIAGEIGESDCAGNYINPLMSWLDSQHTSYLPWTWNTWNCSSGPALITDYNGTPTNYGAAYKAHLASLGGGGGGGGGGTSGALHAVGAGKCLDVPNQTTTAGTQLEIWDCNGGSNQQWTHTSAGQLAVYSGSSQMCLDANNNQTAPAPRSIIWTVRRRGRTSSGTSTPTAPSPASSQDSAST